MEFAGMNPVGIGVAAMASYVFGSVWYMALGKPWMAALEKTEAEIKKNMSAVPFIAAFLCQVVMAIVLAGVIGHLGADAVTIRNGVISALMIWVGFVLTTLIVNHRFQGATWSLTAIDGGHWLGVLVIQGLAIGWFGT